MWKIGAPIAKGQFGSVCQLQAEGSCDVKAAKVIQANQWETLKELFFISQGLRHPHLCNWDRVLVDDEKVYIVMPLYRANLFDLYIPNCSCAVGPTVSESLLQRWGSQLLRAVAFLREHEFIHGDIKPANVLIDDQNNVYLCDFSLTQVHPPWGTSKGLLYTLWWRPPEVFRERTSYPADVWAVGMTLLFLASSRRLFSSSEDGYAQGLTKLFGVPDVRSSTPLTAFPSISSQIESLKVITNRTDLSDAFYTALAELLEFDPARRKKAREAVQEGSYFALSSWSESEQVHHPPMQFSDTGARIAPNPIAIANSESGSDSIQPETVDLVSGVDAEHREKQLTLLYRLYEIIDEAYRPLCSVYFYATELYDRIAPREAEPLELTDLVALVDIALAVANDCVAWEVLYKYIIYTPKANTFKDAIKKKFSTATAFSNGVDRRRWYYVTHYLRVLPPVSQTRCHRIANTAARDTMTLAIVAYIFTVQDFFPDCIEKVEMCLRSVPAVAEYFSHDVEAYTLTPFERKIIASIQETGGKGFQIL